MRRWASETGFNARQRYTIEIPPGPGDRPGHRVLAPSRAMFPPMPLGRDGSREDFRVLLTRRGSTFGAVLLGTIEDRGDPRQSARRAIDHAAERGLTGASNPQRDTVAGEPACRYRMPMNTATLLEWKFAHRGWLFTAGALCLPWDNEAEIMRRARALLATWTWIDAEELPTGPLWQSQAPPGFP